MKKTLCLQTVNGIFVVFNEYDDESQFEDFVKFIETKLHIGPLQISAAAYSLISEFEFENRPVVAMYYEETGCCIRVSEDDLEVARKIISLCYGLE